MNNAFSITPLNESAALVSFGNVIDESVNEKVISLHRLLDSNHFRGFVESVPAYSSLAVFYNSIEVIQSNTDIKSAFDFVREYLENALAHLPQGEVLAEDRIIEVPVLYHGEDLELVADLHQLPTEEVIAIHASKIYRVFMIGFLPGFPYMGTLDARIATPRKISPRTTVPPGSVGIAGFQTGIYPQPSPGGWQLIGRTPIKIFDNLKPVPCMFKPGDRVQFYAVDQYEFEKLDEY